jgi:hypothetical protein
MTTCSAVLNLEADSMEHNMPPYAAVNRFIVT